MPVPTVRALEATPAARGNCVIVHARGEVTLCGRAITAAITDTVGSVSLDHDIVLQDFTLYPNSDYKA